MGNSHTKEARDPNAPLSPHDPRSHASGHHASGSSSSRPRNRASRSDLGGLFGISAGSSSSTQPPYERRETKQEREARKLERERQARLIERERSLKEEHVDGGYLVTLGTYVGTEDFNKAVVRQLQIERRLAPFWRGLNDFSETWTEYQIVAAARGLPLPAADAIPPDELIPRPISATSPAASTQNIDSLMVPMGGRTQSTASDRSGSGLGSSLPSPTSAPSSKSPFKRSKGIAAALNLSSSRNNSTTDIAAPREIKLPHDPFVNGQPMEVFLYKDGSECPICFLYYPPYLNHTRCCDQPICSECFVQIKRADPHYPDGHGDAQNSERPPEEQAGLLISEPACCPYCQQPELGVTYDPPPFRRGLTYSSPTPHMGTMGTAMSSSSSLNSSLSPSSLASPTSMGHSRRRTQSLSANAPNVVTTDRVRPDWATKLAAQRAHIARRAAAATALHTAAFLMSNNEQQRSLRIGRFSRRNTAERTAPGPSTNAAASNSPARPEVAAAESESASPGTGEARSSSGRGIMGARRSRMEDLEEMMFAEAIRLSLAAEEERKRKAEKEERKEAKRKEKEDKKAAKAAAKSSGSGPYTGSSGNSSIAGSALSLPGLGLGRRRGNSAASNLRMEASVASAVAASGSGSPESATAAGGDKGKGVERPMAANSGDSSEHAEAGASSSMPAGSQPISSPQRPGGHSHLRQISNVSSVSDSSFVDASGGVADEGRTAATGVEPTPNMTSLSEVVDVLDEVDHAKSHDAAEVQHLENATDNKPPSKDAGEAPSPPELVVTPGTPALNNEGFETNKQLDIKPTAQHDDQQQQRQQSA
ncbi:SNF1-interacting protein [Pyricularia oryzae]|uniref:SNF1-interacting protein n=2 Tax=Pyricularia TaxID=48558 RepID=A0ABQ8NU56_PYRGI|nr:SNF1-interacting protein [Pyricularia oryzae]KAI6302166.1 SNF1-interacting protein [Pyricularia grisea]KAH9433244.1 SNF1-interacting protein [Pyricularia oryzae]KAI6261507.1 SNF1-interacting protein [Pyricularia oryzae]KAI6288578.1 SNF1-interacting protein [Pyricularia oryzae]